MAARTARLKSRLGRSRHARRVDRRHVARRHQKGSGDNTCRSSARSSTTFRSFAPTGRGPDRDTWADQRPQRRHGAPRARRAIVGRRVQTSSTSPDFHNGDRAAAPLRPHQDDARRSASSRSACARHALRLTTRRRSAEAVLTPAASTALVQLGVAAVAVVPPIGLTLGSP